jgi:geranylgeranyl diphosphate synthase type I
METQAPLEDAAAAPSPASWLEEVRHRIDEQLRALLASPDEDRLDPRWARALEETRAFTLRPAKRLRPALVLAGWSLARNDAPPPEWVWRFAAAVELLHTFLLVHDDVADRAELRRGGPPLHLRLGGGDPRGSDLAVVMGDHLFSRAVEAMLECDAVGVVGAVRYYLGVCRVTAAGQFLDLELSGAALGGVTLFQTLKVAMLKTARYGFAAPLVVGARLGGADDRLTAALERAGRQIGLAFQLRDDLLGLFGTPEATGKAASDWLEGKPTFPVIAAYTRAPRAVRRAMEDLWRDRASDASAHLRARELVEAHGGRAAAERAAARACRAALRSVHALPAPVAPRDLLDALIRSLAPRET